jgi:hypothetical protein
MSQDKSEVYFYYLRFISSGDFSTTLLLVEIPLTTDMTFYDLRQNLLENLRRRVRSGETTERRLAKHTGVSQPHLHNVLKGKRVLSFEKADEILARLHLDVLDLIPPEVIAGIQCRR